MNAVDSLAVVGRLASIGHDYPELAQKINGLISDVFCGKDTTPTKPAPDVLVNGHTHNRLGRAYSIGQAEAVNGRVSQATLFSHESPDPIADHPHTDKEWMTVKEASSAIGLGTGAISGWCRGGLINAERVRGQGQGGTQWRIERQEVDRYLRHGHLSPCSCRN